MDATPFANSVKKTNGDTGTDESKSLVDELGEMLRTCGFNYHGVEVLYSGVYGTELLLGKFKWGHAFLSLNR